MQDLEIAGLKVVPRSHSDTLSEAATIWAGCGAAESLQELTANHSAQICSITELPEPVFFSSSNYKQQRPALSPFSIAVSEIQPYSHPLTTHQYSSAHAQELTKLTCFDIIAKACITPSGPKAANAHDPGIAATEISDTDLIGSYDVRDAFLASDHQLAASPPELAVPMLPDLTVRLDMLDDMLTGYEGPQVLPDQERELSPLARHNIAGNSQASFDSCMADHMVLQDSYQTLPMIFFNSDTDCDEAESCIDRWQQLITECHVRPIKVGHLELYMPPSLTDRTQPCPSELQAYKRTLDQTFVPVPLQHTHSDLQPVTIPNSSLVLSIAGEQDLIQSLMCNPAQLPEQLPHAIQMRLQKGKMQKGKMQHLVSNGRTADAIGSQPIPASGMHQITAVASKSTAQSLPDPATVTGDKCKTCEFSL